MKTLASALFIFLCITANAQDIITIKTSKGMSIEAIVNIPELSPSDIDYVNNQFITTFPQATFVDNSTRAYNCHSYAWNMTEGGPKCWINQYKSDESSNIALYWEGGSFSETYNQNAQKIFYPDGDHSAIMYNATSNIYQSKWGQGPLMRHAPGYGPYTNMNNRRYFRNGEPMTGEIFCSINNRSIYVNENATFTIKDSWPKDYAYSVEILNAKDEEDVVGSKAIITDSSLRGVTVTFKAAGLYHLSFIIYAPDGDKVIIYTCEPAVATLYPYN